MAHRMEPFLTPAPAVWPGEPLPVQPGDLSRFAPMGSGLGMPPLMMPWDNLESAASRDAFYGFQPHSGHPICGAPVTEAGGGTVYFGGDCRREDIEAMLRLMEVRSDSTDYAAFLRDAEDGEEDCLTQLRIVSGFALRHLFGITDSPEGAALHEQEFSVGEVVWRFIEQFRKDTGSAAGLLGGDGDWACESPAFGFMVENSYYGICLIWSRAWLVTK